MALDFRTRKRYKQIVFSRLSLGVLVVLALVLARGLWGVYQSLSDSERNLARIEEDFVELEEREIFLESELGRLRTSAGVDEEIRERFGLIREGEGIIVVVEDGETAEMKKESGSLWNAIRSWFR